MSPIISFILKFVEQPLLLEEETFLTTSLEKFYTKNPKAAAALVAGVYPFIDSIVEDLAAHQSTPYATDEVNAVKGVLEAFAKEHGFALTDLDNDASA